ncbi:MAG: PTS transporter subunit IIC, partial [Candidatus Korarchaeota archaeon]|nr:PTS transporter subunit IIC [Candidatus Korarchaeota archaeon]
MDIVGAVQWFLGLGATVAIPIILFIVGLAFKIPASKAFRAALTIACGFVGINLVIGLLWGTMSDVAQAMVQRTGIELTVIDVGWPAAAAIAWGTIVGALTIPIDFIINIIMLALGLTKTMDIDFWNYWHFAFTGSLVTMATDSVPLGLIASAINAIIVFKLGDWTAEGVQEMLGIPGISLPHGFSAAYVPIGIPIKKLIDAIPPLRDVKA